MRRRPSCRGPKNNRGPERPGRVDRRWGLGGSVAGGLLLPGVPVLALQGLDDQPGADRLGGGLHAGGGAVNQGDDLLEVRPEGAAGDAGGLQAEAALLDRLAVPGALLAELGLLAGEMALVGHGTPLERAGSVGGGGLAGYPPRVFRTRA